MTPFRFLDLPVEVRLIVYESMGNYVHHIYCEKTGATFGDERDSVPMLQTCKQVNLEASAILKKTVSKLAKRYPEGERLLPKILTPAWTPTNFITTSCAFFELLNEFFIWQASAHRPSADFDKFWAFFPQNFIPIESPVAQWIRKHGTEIRRYRQAGEFDLKIGIPFPRKLIKKSRWFVMRRDIIRGFQKWAKKYKISMVLNFLDEGKAWFAVGFNVFEPSAFIRATMYCKSSVPIPGHWVDGLWIRELRDLDLDSDSNEEDAK